VDSSPYDFRVKKLAAIAPPGSRWRRYWELPPGVAFLNHGSFGACPKPILALQHKLRREMETEPVQFLWRRYDERLDVSRRAVAAFIGAEPADVVFVPNATTAVNAVVRSLKLRPGDQILTTAHDYNACRNVLVEAARLARAELVVAPVPFPLGSEENVIEAILRRVTRRTRFAMLDHVTSSTGLVFPVATLVQELETRGIDVLVDGAHAPGMAPLNVSKLRPAWYTGNLHKWVCAPKGAAFLWARPDRQAAVQPAVISHGNNTPRRGYTAFQDRFDWSGTLDPTPWMCAGEAIAWMGKLLPGGWRELRQTNRNLVVQARRLLSARLGLQPPCPETMLGSMATLPLPEPFQAKPKTEKIDAEQLRLYDEFGIEVMLYRCGTPERRCFRISAQIYNSLRQYEYLGDALERISHSLSESKGVRMPRFFNAESANINLRKIRGA
jgi:isopenicillin-N epimerase